MAKARKFCAYRRLERPYTRRSKYRKKAFVRANPHNKIVKYDMGDAKKDFECTLVLISKADLQIRDSALESARLTANRTLESGVGKTNFYLKLRVYPHHILRENPLASGAGADRMSTGMKMSFGKVIGIAAQIKKGQAIFELNLNKEHLKTGKTSLEKAFKKLPCKCSIVEMEG